MSARCLHCLIWLRDMLLLVAVMSLVTGIIVSPKKPNMKTGTFVMYEGRGAILSPEEDAQHLQKLRNSGINVPQSMIDAAYEKAAANLRRKKMAHVLYGLAAASFMVGAAIFAFTGGFRAGKSRLSRPSPTPPSSGD